MTRLAHRLASLERSVAAHLQRIGPTQDERKSREAFGRGLTTLLANMPEERARAVIDDLRHGRVLDQPITRRAVVLVGSALPAPGKQECVRPDCECLDHYGHNDPLALPAAVCDLLEEHPDAVFGSYNCARCGYHPGERSWDELGRYGKGEVEVTPSGRTYSGGPA